MPLEPVRASLKSFLQQPALKRGPQRLLVAVSGGADSVALLRAAAAEAPGLGWQVEALHCDHGLRPASKAEARFVDALCQRLDLTLYAYQGGLKRGPNLEERARLWRRSCYADAAAKSGAKLILLGQHAQDQAETLLLNLVRGTGGAGAQGMLPLAPLDEGRGTQLGRPFLALLPAELRAYLKRLRQPWKEDASNRDKSLRRNRLRHGVLPILDSINPQAVANLAAFAARAQAGKPARDLAGLLKLSAAARQRAQAVLLAGRGSADLGSGWSLAVSGGQKRVAKTSPAGADLRAQTLRPGAELAWSGWSIQLKPGKAQARKLKEGKAFWFSADLGSASLVVRPAREAERLQAFGLKGSKLVRDLLAEAKVPVWQRAEWPVLEADGRVLAVLGVRRGQGFEVQAGEEAWCLSWKSPF